AEMWAQVVNLRPESPEPGCSSISVAAASAEGNANVVIARVNCVDRYPPVRERLYDGRRCKRGKIPALRKHDCISQPPNTAVPYQLIAFDVVALRVGVSLFESDSVRCPGGERLCKMGHHYLAGVAGILNGKRPLSCLLT